MHVTIHCRDLQDCITLAEGVNSTAGRLLHMDDYSLLSEVKLILDQIEGVFTNPPRTTPWYELVSSQTLFFRLGSLGTTQL